MSLYQDYELFKKNQITFNELASRMGITPPSLRARMNAWKDDFGKVLTILDRLEQNELNSGEAAEILHCSTRQINKLRDSYGVKRQIHPRVVDHAASQIRWEVSKTFALGYIAGRLNIARAAEEAGMSERNMRRWVARLLDKHSSLTYKEHARLSLSEMQKVAKEVEEKENLSIQTQMLADAIARGQKSIREEAVQRALFLRKRKKPNAQE